MKGQRTLGIALGAFAMMTSCHHQTSIRTEAYPAAERGEVTDDYFGTRVGDPYRWLEDDRSEATARWVAAENTFTQSYLEQIPYRQAIRKRLETLWNYPKEGVAVRHGDYYYAERNDGLRNQSAVYRMKSPEDVGEVVFDPNTLSEDGTVAMIDYSFSKDGRYMAYALARSGSDWVEIGVTDLQQNRPTDDRIEWVKFSGAAWAADSRGFYYSRYDKPEGNIYSSKNEGQKVYYHRLGQPQSEDRLVYSDANHPLRYFDAAESDDGRWLFLNASNGDAGSEVLYRPAGSTGRFRMLLPGFEHVYRIVRAEGDRAWVLTNADALNYRLIAVDLKNPQAPWTEVLPENPDVLLEQVTAVGDGWIAVYMQDAQHKVFQYDRAGHQIREVQLPGGGTVEGFEGEPGDGVTCYTVDRFTQPATLYRLDCKTGVSTPCRVPELPFDAAEYTTEQLFFESKDGTQVPMFIVYRRGMKRDGTHPLYLYGYGGFDISLTPTFSPARMLLLEQGGIYAQVTLRGGGEYGEAWHKAGMRERKQNVFDDFIAAAEYLVRNRYTSPEKLAIAGGSNGGLLVGACEVQRPDLYAVCLPAVGVMDMLRFHKFTIGWGWVPEYGSSDEEDQFAYLYRYSPLHNIREGVCYPATLVTTADHDDRVVPGHSFKFAAALQHAQGCDRPILIRIDSKAGHGAGKPVGKRIEEATDVYSFLFWNTHTDYRPLE